MSRKRRTTVLASAAVALVAAAAGLVVWRTSGSDAATAPVPPHDGRFVVECTYDRSATIDPIVHFGMPGMSHLHDFFGNTSVTAGSTTESLVEGDTTCRTKQDRAAYWAPALYDGERKLDPASSDAYYRAAPGVDPATVQPFPLGLQMLGGNQFSTVEQDTAIVGFTCGTNPRRHAAPPTCSEDSALRVRVTFPDCWDGEHLASDDHVSHVARSDAAGCPDSHPVALPQLEFVVEYPFSGDPSNLRLASGETFTAHADFFNAWDPDKLAGEVRLCINADVVCGVAHL